jgi:glycosyltransferase involved in cell wall biosynthesis
MIKPTVSIGVPIFNAEISLCAALESLLSQTFNDFEIIISDNSSFDKTENICRSYLAKDKRIKYYRQIKNIGAEANFLFVLEKSVGKYFMWAAADDVRSNNFIELNIEFLEKNRNYVSSISPVKFYGGDFDQIKMGDRSLDDDRFDIRFRKFFGPWHANGAFYSLIRTKKVKQCEWVGKKFLGADWIIVLYLAKQGKLNRISTGWLELGVKGVSHDGGIFRYYKLTLLDSILPFWKMSMAVYKLFEGASFYSKLILLKECLAMNVRAINLQTVGWLYRKYKSIKTTTNRVANRETRL